VSKNLNYLKKTIEIRYENKDYIVFNKPAGLLVTPTYKNELNTLVHIVNYQFHAREKALADVRSFNVKLHPCHRIDRETSGLVIFAKGKRHQQIMMDVFQKRLIHKEYIALAHGMLDKQEGEFRTSIASYKKEKLNRYTAPRLALTRYKVIDKRKDCCVVKVWPFTGRTNQIRIHFSKNGHPLLGERKYAFPRDYSLKFKRVALHASRLIWDGIESSKKISVQAPLPEDMELFLRDNK